MFQNSFSIKRRGVNKPSDACCMLQGRCVRRGGGGKNNNILHLVRNYYYVYLCSYLRARSSGLRLYE